MSLPRKRIAIVGSGVSGLAALYTLRNSGHEVHLFEQADRLGGHTNTVDWNWEGKSIKVDTGFIVLNSFTYPNFIAFLKELGIETVDTEMSFSVSRDNGIFEWAGTSIRSVFAQRENLFRLSFWRMLFDIIRFNAFALDLLDDPNSDYNNISIGTYLDQQGYSKAFRDDYILPMTACIWSTGPEKCALDFPAVTLVRFLWNHHLLTVSSRPTWMTIPGGSKRYIDAVMQSLPPSREHRNMPITKIRSITIRDGQTGYMLRTSADFSDHGPFDDVIFACHADQTLDILGKEATPEERNCLKNFKTTANIAYLHSDLSLLPRNPSVWAAWNYLTTTPNAKSHSTSLSPSRTSLSATSKKGQNGTILTNQTAQAQSQTEEQNQHHQSPPPTSTVTLTYNMNILQHIPKHIYNHVLITLNPPPLQHPSPSLTQAIIPYRHPLYTPAAIHAQQHLLPAISGTRGLHFAGAWTGYGFHEDGFVSGVRAALAACRRSSFSSTSSTTSGGDSGSVDDGGDDDDDDADAGLAHQQQQQQVKLVETREIRGKRPSLGCGAVGWAAGVWRIVLLLALIAVRLLEMVGRWWAKIGRRWTREEEKRRRASVVMRRKKRRFVESFGFTVGDWRKEE